MSHWERAKEMMSRPDLDDSERVKELGRENLQLREGLLIADRRIQAEQAKRQELEKRMREQVAIAFIKGSQETLRILEGERVRVSSMYDRAREYADRIMKGEDNG